MKNPKAENLAQNAARDANRSQGGSMIEGSGGDGKGGDKTPKYTGHESAASPGVAGGVPMNGRGGSKGGGGGY